MFAISQHTCSCNTCYLYVQVILVNHENHEHHEHLLNHGEPSLTAVMVNHHQKLSTIMNIWLTMAGVGWLGGHHFEPLRRAPPAFRAFVLWPPPRCSVTPNNSQDRGDLRAMSTWCHRYRGRCSSTLHNYHGDIPVTTPAAHPNTKYH